MAAQDGDWNIRSKSLQASFLYMYEKKIQCDVIINFLGQSLDAHKFMITSRTAAFRDALGGENQHDTTKQKERGREYAKTSKVDNDNGSNAEENEIEKSERKRDELARKQRGRNSLISDSTPEDIQNQFYAEGKKAGRREIKGDELEHTDSDKESEEESETDTDLWSETDTEIESETNSDCGSDAAIDLSSDTESDNENYRESDIKKYKEEEVKDEIKKRVRDEVRNEIKVEVSDNVKWKVMDEVRDELKCKVKGEVNVVVKNEGRDDKVKWEVSKKLEDEGNDQVQEKVRSGVKDEVKKKLRQKNKDKEEQTNKYPSKILVAATNIIKIEEKEEIKELKGKDTQTQNQKLREQSGLKEEIRRRHQNSGSISNGTVGLKVTDAEGIAHKLEEVANQSIKQKARKRKKKVQLKSPCFTVTKTTGGFTNIDVSQEGLEECTFENFETFIRYLYCEKADIIFENVLQLLVLGQKFTVPPLVTACTVFLYKHCMVSEDVCSILSQSLLLGIPALTRKCLKFISKNAKLALTSPGFNCSDENVILAILSSTNLIIPEVDLFTSCVEWGKKECGGEIMRVEPDLLRAKLSNVLPLIRFPLMSLEEFNNKVIPTKLLTTEEKLDVYQSLTIPDYISTFFSSKPRHFRTARLIKFDSDYTALPSCTHPQKLHVMDFACHIHSRSSPKLKALHFSFPQRKRYQLMYANFEIRNQKNMLIYGDHINSSMMEFNNKIMQLFIIEEDVALENGAVCDIWKLQLHKTGITVGSITIRYHLMFTDLTGCDLDPETAAELFNSDRIKKDLNTTPPAFSEFRPLIRIGRIHGRSVKFDIRGLSQPLFAMEVYYK